MGEQLWYSKNNRVSRRGTTFNELQNIFIDNITTKLICEPILSCCINDNPADVRLTMRTREFDTVGVVNNNNEMEGYIKLEDIESCRNLSDCILPYDISLVISDSTPISDLLDLLAERERLYVISGNIVGGIVTRADINKPVVRIYLFGIISLFELHLNYWISKYFEGEDWRGCLNDNRFEKAQNLHQQRVGNNVQLSLLECLQLCDKKTILSKTEMFLSTYGYSKRVFKGILERCEIIRNELAHSQNSIVSNLEWSSFAKTIKQIKSFLTKSEEEKIK